MSENQFEDGTPGNADEDFEYDKIIALDLPEEQIITKKNGNDESMYTVDEDHHQNFTSTVKPYKQIFFPTSPNRSTNSKRMS